MTKSYEFVSISILLKYTKVHRGKVNFSRSLNSWLQSQDWSSYLGDSGVQAPSAVPVNSDIGVLRWSSRQRDRCRTSGSHTPSCAQGSQFSFPGCQGLALVQPHRWFLPRDPGIDSAGSCPALTSRPNRRDFWGREWLSKCNLNLMHCCSVTTVSPMCVWLWGSQL